LWLSWNHPLAFFLVLAALLVVMVTVTVLLFGFLRGLGRKLRGHFMPTQVNPGGP